MLNLKKNDEIKVYTLDSRNRKHCYAGTIESITKNEIAVGIVVDSYRVFKFHKTTGRSSNNEYWIEL